MRKARLFMLLLPFLFGIQQPVTGSADMLGQPQLPAETGPKAEAAALPEAGAPSLGLAVPFIENRGQIDSRVKYYARTFHGTVFVTGDGTIVYSLPRRSGRQIPEATQSYDGVAIYESLIGAASPHLLAKDQAAARVSRYVGPDPKTWRKNLATYATISLGEVYKGIELELSAHGNTVEKIFRVRPGADYRQIRLSMKGGEALTFNQNGQLSLKTPLGEVLFSTPIAYQETIEQGRRKRQYVDIAYLVQGDEYSFALGPYDQSRELIIDPMIASTYLGGSGDDTGHQMALNGAVYVVGTTTSTDFPVTPGAFQCASCGLNDAYIAKFSYDLNTLESAAIIGGMNIDTGNTLIIDEVGNVYMAGLTESDQFPSPTGSIASKGGQDMFVAKFNSTLSELLASQLIGGDRDELTYAMGLNRNGEVIVAGISASDADSTGIGTQLWQNSNRQAGTDDTNGWNTDEYDLLIIKLTSSLEILAATYFGGSDEETCLGLDIDTANNIYIAGTTKSVNNPPDTTGLPGTANSAMIFRTHHGGGTNRTDAFIVIFAPDLTLQRAAYVGGSDDDFGTSILWDPNGYLYLAGNTRSSNFPGASTAKGQDAYLIKLKDDLASEPEQAVFIQGAKDEYAVRVTRSAAADLYLAGHTGSPDLAITQNAFSTALQGSADAFIAKFDSNLNKQVLSYLGGTGADEANTMILHVSGHVFISGNTSSTDFPIQGTSSSFHGGTGDAFIARLDSQVSDPNSTIPQYTVSITMSPAGLGGKVSSIPAGLTCTEDCNQNVDENTVVQLVIDAPTGYQTKVTGCAGNLDQDIYTTGAITADCTIDITFNDGSGGGGATYRFPYHLIRAAIDHPAAAKKAEQVDP